jgi:hypothetical protein
MTAKTARIETLVAELATCTTSAMRRCVVDSLFAAIGQDGSLASHASEKADEAGMYRFGGALNEHRHVLNALRVGLDNLAAEHSIERDRELHAALG